MIASIDREDIRRLFKANPLRFNLNKICIIHLESRKFLAVEAMAEFGISDKVFKIIYFTNLLQKVAKLVIIFLD